MMELLPHQKDVINSTRGLNHVAYYLDMGLGKTFVGAEKMARLGSRFNLVICQKSKIKDWYDHFNKYYNVRSFDFTHSRSLRIFLSLLDEPETSPNYNDIKVGIINYERAWRRPELLKLGNFTLMLDESSLIQNVKAKQTKFILKMQPENVILLSGTPTSGKYENLWSQASLLGWRINQDVYDSTYINWTLTEDDGSGFRHRIVDKDNPYKNVERLKAKFRENGAVFMKTEEVLELPEQVLTVVNLPKPKLYNKFVKNSYLLLPDGIELIGDRSLTKRLCMRQLCSIYNDDRINATKDLLESSNDRFIVFYSFDAELDKLISICDELNRPVSVVNGHNKDLNAYENESNSITLIQYQAGAMGLNLQLCNKVIYYSLPERSDLFEQSKKRIHRIGTSSTCFYYVLMCSNTIDENIYNALLLKRDYTDNLFKKDLQAQ